MILVMQSPPPPLNTHHFIVFSGTSKKRRKEETTGKNVKRLQHELDHYGLVPLPVKVCYTCSRYPSHSTLIWKEMVLIFLVRHFVTFRSRTPHYLKLLCGDHNYRL